jgi:hypothetical protein
MAITAVKYQYNVTARVDNPMQFKMEDFKPNYDFDSALKGSV